jgi:hypothetical protein
MAPAAIAVAAAIESAPDIWSRNLTLLLRATRTSEDCHEAVGPTLQVSIINARR